MKHSTDPIGSLAAKFFSGNGLHRGLHVGNKLCVLLVAAHDIALRVKEYDTGNGRNAVDVGCDILGVEYLRPGQTVCLYGFESVCRLVPYCHSEKVHLVGVLVVEVLDYGSLAYAGAAPACPEIDERVFAFADIVAEFLGLAVVGYFKILEFMARGSFFFVQQALLEGIEAMAGRELGILSKILLESGQIP